MTADLLPELDARALAPRVKHATIFAAFEGLAEGEAFVLVNDHDPVPLRYQFEMAVPGRYGWAYLEAGPELWRVQIARVAEGAVPEDHAPMPTEKGTCRCGHPH